MEVTNLVKAKKTNLEPLSFATVKKETIGQTFEHWNRLLKSQSVENLEYFKDILSPSSPLSAFEEKLRLILIDTFQLKNEVLNVLLSQNDYSIKRVLKCKWFFQNLSAEVCTEKIFPSVSFSVRFKIINKLSRYLESEEEAEKIFTFFASNFGSEGAESLLPKCSSEFILNYCQKLRPLITLPIWKRERILLNICKRYHETGFQILDLKLGPKAKDLCYDSYSRRILQYLASNHVDLFISFFKKHIQEFYTYPRTFSGKISWRLVQKFENLFFESRLIDSDILNTKYVFLKLKTDDRIKFLSTLVHLKSNKLTLNNWNQARGKMIDLIRCIQPSQRYSIIISVFKEVYDLNFQDHSKYWYFDLLEMLPLEDRQYFAENIERIYLSSEAEFKESLPEEYHHEQQEIESAIYLYEFSKAFTKFKRIIRKSPEKFRRENIMLHMIKCCKINNNARGLKEVVDFVTINYRQEDKKILFNFISSVYDLFSGEITSSVCRKIKNLISFCSAKGSPNVQSFIRFAERDIYLCLDDNKQPEDLIEELFDVAVVWGNSYVCMRDYKNKHSRTLLLALGGKTRDWIKNHITDTTWERFHSCWINTCERFNDVNKKNKVFLRDVSGYAEALKLCLENKHKKLSIQNWPIESLETCKVQALNPRDLSKLYCHFLKTNPKLLIQDLEIVLDLLDAWMYPVLIKRLTLLGLTERLKKAALTNFQNKNTFGERKNALNIYSCLCTIEEFTDLIQEYIPQENAIAPLADRVFVEIQFLIPKVINRIRPRWKNLNLVLKFFCGDFLKQAIRPFYSTCCHSRVDFIVPFLNDLIVKVPARVSYTKHIIKLIFLLSNRDESINFGLKLWKDNKHYSIRKIILNFLTKKFLEEPSSELFKSLVDCLLESEEAMFIGERPDITMMPEEFVGQYTETLWNVSESFTVKNNFRTMLISKFNLENIYLLPEKFCEKVLREYFSNPESVVMGRFAAFYCAAEPNLTEIRIENIFELMEEFKTDAERAASFLSTVRSVSHTKPAQFLNVFSTFLKIWPYNNIMYEEKLQYLYYKHYYQTLESFSERNEVSVEFAVKIKNCFLNLPNLDYFPIIIVATLRQFLKEIRIASLPFHSIVFFLELIRSYKESLWIISLATLSSELVESYEKGDDFRSDDDVKLLEEIRGIFYENDKDLIYSIYLGKILQKNEPVIPA